jgi:hypothetical protein
MCSTPFGINERQNAIIVGAFRHQRTNDQEIDLPDRAACIECAQRLSASTNERLTAAVGTVVISDVLNAFRHQRTNDKKYSGSWLKSLWGAQRLSASTNALLWLRTKPSRLN